MILHLTLPSSYLFLSLYKGRNKEKFNETQRLNPWGYSDMFIYIGLANFGGSKIKSFNIFGGFQNNEYFGGMKMFVNIFVASLINWI